MTTRTDLNTADIERGYDDDRWLGWGYLGGRRDLNEAAQEAADARVLDYANEHGWDYDRLFAWLNSRPGRHYADWPTHPKAAELLFAELF